MSDASLPTDPAPKTKKTPAKRQRRNYAAELVELQANVKVALKLLMGRVMTAEASDPVGQIIETVVELLEGKD